ncbi:unnamed protein product [Sympodiomycopsis kandeliae]
MRNEDDVTKDPIARTTSQPKVHLTTSRTSSKVQSQPNDDLAHSMAHLHMTTNGKSDGVDLSENDRQLHISLQEDELLALEAIYSAGHVHITRGGDDQAHTVSFNLPVSLNNPTNVHVTEGQNSSVGDQVSDLQVSHLPPLFLRVSLPPAYPLRAPPKILHMTSPWLPRTSSSQHTAATEWITERLMQQWDEVKGEILWSWGEWLREGWVEEALNASQEPGPFASKIANIPTATSTKKPNKRSSRQATFSALQFYDDDTLGEGSSKRGVSTQGLTATLAAYDRLAKQSAFDKDRFLCGICLEAKKGDACVRIQHCGHVFCRECMTDYLTLHLTEGSLHLAQSCPDPSCVARPADRAQGDVNLSQGETESGNNSGHIAEEQIIAILRDRDDGGQPDLIERLRFLQDKAKAEADPTAVPCPRADCQTLTSIRDEDKGSGGRWEAFRQCTRCGMSFCVWCYKTWHGPSKCELSSTSSLLDKYDRGDEATKRVMEVKYGRKNLLRLKAAYEEEKANESWMKGKTQSCPNCSSRIEKSSGCNHMSCRNCMTHFCYLCGTRLNPAHVYEHFNTRTSKCFNRLFDGVLERPPEDDEGGEGAEEGTDDGELSEAQRERRREQEQHLLALAAIQAAYGED